GLSELGFALADLSVSFSAIEQIVSKMHAKRAEVAREERDVVLVAVSSERIKVGQILPFGQTYGCGGFFYFGTRLLDFRMRFQCGAEALFAFTTVANFINRFVEDKLSRQRQADGVVQLYHPVGELQLGCQQLLSR